MEYKAAWPAGGGAIVVGYKAAWPAGGTGGGRRDRGVYGCRCWGIPNRPAVSARDQLHHSEEVGVTDGSRPPLLVRFSSLDFLRLASLLSPFFFFFPTGGETGDGPAAARLVPLRVR